MEFIPRGVFTYFSFCGSPLYNSKSGLFFTFRIREVFFFFFKLSSHFSPSHFKECFFSVANVNPSHSLLQFLYKILSVHNGKKRLFEFRNMLRSSFCQKKPKWLEYTGLGFVQRKSVLCLIENALLFNSIQNFSSKCHRYLVWDFSR